MQAQVKQRALPGNESVLRLIWQEPLGRAGLLGVTLIVILAVLAPLISPFDVAKMHPKDLHGRNRENGERGESAFREEQHDGDKDRQVLVFVQGAI